MKFKNAYEGVSRMYQAEIVALFAMACTLIGIILVFAGVGAAEVVSKGLGGGLAIGGSIFMIATSLLLIASYILNIFGVNMAAKDEPMFKKALIAIIVGIIAAIVVGLFSNNTTVAGIGRVVSRLCEMMVFWFCISGIGRLATSLENAGVQKKADDLIKFIFGLYIVAIILEFIGIFVSFSTFVETIFAFVVVICSVVSYLLYLGLLSDAKTMLA